MSALISNPAVKNLLRNSVLWAPLWLFTAAMTGAVGFLYAHGVKQDIYSSTQPIFLPQGNPLYRDVRGLTNFQSVAIPEVICQLAITPEVVAEALSIAGVPPKIETRIDLNRLPIIPELKEELSRFRNSEESSISPLKFVQARTPSGHLPTSSQVVYLDTYSTTAEHAAALNMALRRTLADRLRLLQQEQTEENINELNRALAVARKSLQESVAQLERALLENPPVSESSILKSQRITSDSNSSPAPIDTTPNPKTSSIEISLATLATELQSCQLLRESLLADREMLDRATADNRLSLEGLAATQSSYTKLQLQQAELANAQSENEQLRLKYTDDHPAVQTSELALNKHSNLFKTELNSSIQNLDLTLSQLTEKIEQLTLKSQNNRETLAAFSLSRPEIAQITATIDLKKSVLQAIERDLEASRTLSAASTNSQFMLFLDAPLNSNDPIGPSNLAITAYSTIAGGILGIGLVILMTPLGPRKNRHDLSEKLRPSEAVFESMQENRVVPKQQTVSLNTDPIQSKPIAAPSARQALPAQSITGRVADVDAAFRELERLSRAKPGSRDEELAILSKINELKSIIDAIGQPSDRTAGEPSGWTRPKKSGAGRA